MRKFYYSEYGPFFEEYIALKRSLGYKYREPEYIFSQFDKLVLSREESSIGISKELSDVWYKKRPHESPKTRYSRIQTIRGFSSFLNTLGYQSHIPDLPKLSKNFTPYIFTKDQINLLFNASDQLKGTRHNLTSKVFIIPALLRLLYGTGLRVSEALSLSCDDLNIKSKYLLLRYTKNGKERLVPISESLCMVCRQYLDYRQNFPILKDSNRLFINPDGSACDIHSAYKCFRRVLYKAKIPHAGKGLGPRLHDLRHTFSVHTLANMAEAGIDLYYSLPVLSTYLGHQSIGATDKYIRLTAEMYPSIIAKISEAFPVLFPEINNLIENETN